MKHRHVGHYRTIKGVIKKRPLHRITKHKMAWVKDKPGFQRFERRKINDIDEANDIRYNLITSPDFNKLSKKQQEHQLTVFETIIIPKGTPARKRAEDIYFGAYGKEINPGLAVRRRINKLEA